MYIFGLIRFKKYTQVADLLKCIFDYFSLIEKLLPNWIAVICGIERKNEHICKAGWKKAKSDRDF